jgi:hypothetical protein
MVQARMTIPLIRTSGSGSTPTKARPETFPPPGAGRAAPKWTMMKPQLKNKAPWTRCRLQDSQGAHDGGLMPRARLAELSW